MTPDSYYVRPKNVASRTGAGGVIVRIEPDSNRLLVALIHDPADGRYILPKGGVKSGETLEAAARREIEEEAGFTRLRLCGELGVGERLNGRRTRWQVTHYLLFVTDQPTATPTEHANWKVEWFDLDHLPELYWREQDELIKHNRERIRQWVHASVT